MRPPIRRLPLSLFAGLLLGGCASMDTPPTMGEPAATRPVAGASASATTPPPADAPTQAALDTLLDRFTEASFAANPPNAVSQGRHEFDGRLPDWSAAAIRRQIAELDAFRAQAVAFTNLTPEQKYQRDYLLARIDGELFWLRDAGTPWHNPSFYTGSLDPSVYLTRPYAPLATRMKAFIAYARAIPGATANIRANLQTPLPKTFLTLGINSFGGYATFYRDSVPGIFAGVNDPALQAQLREAIGPASQAMQGLADWLKSEQPRGTDAYALGPARFAKMIRDTEGVTTPLAELEAIGRADLARNTAALKAACARFAPGLTVLACIDRMNANKPVGNDPVAEARRQLPSLRGFLTRYDLVTIPGPEEALVNESPPYQRWNSAYIDIAGPFEKNMPSTYYIAPPDPTWTPAEQASYIPGKEDLLFTSVHEVWPGHFLQFLHANRSPFTFGRVFVGYAFAEGWAHYTEEMMWDAGLGQGSPETHIGQLSNALLRNVRYLCAIGLHTKGMSVETCERMFREEGFQDPGNARQQAARGTYDPAYLNYTMGKLMIMKLRDDWTAPRGGRVAWKAFHDQFLSYGGPPIPLVRKQMLDGIDDGRLFAAPAARPETAPAP